LDRMIGLAGETVDWEPQLKIRFEEQKEAMVGPDGFLLDTGAMDTTHRMAATFHYSRGHDLSEPMFGLSLAGNVSSLSTKKRLYGVKAEDLMKRWNIGLKAATQTIQVTTQRGIRTILHPTLPEGSEQMTDSSDTGGYPVRCLLIPWKLLLCHGRGKIIMHRCSPQGLVEQGSFL